MRKVLMGFTGVRDREVLEAAKNGKGWFISDDLRDAAGEALEEMRILRREKQELSRANAELRPLKERNVELLSDLATTVESNATLRAKLADAEAQNTALAVEVVGADEAVKARDAKLAALEAELKSLRGAATAISRLEVEKAGLETELDKCRDSYGRLAVQHEETNDKLRHAETRLTVVAGDKLKAETERESLRRSLKSALADKERLEKLADERYRVLDTINNALQGITF